MKNFNFQAMLKHGFLIIPKALLQQQIEDRHMQEGEIEALLKILMKVNYSDTLYNDRQNKNCLCKRGESLFSYRVWSHIFHWSVGKAFRFIHELATLGIIEIISHPNNSSLHIRVVEYDKWMGVPDSDKQKKKAVNEEKLRTRLEKLGIRGWLDLAGRKLVRTWADEIGRAHV